MSRLWDTPEFWARQEADEILNEYTDSSPAELAESFEKTMASYDGDAADAAAILSELKRRAEAGIRFWPGPTLVEPSAVLAGADIGEDDIPW